jgi:hypothetical protein
MSDFKNVKFQNGKNVKNVRFQKCQISKMSDFKNVRFIILKKI